jgi:preprotein translocase subunit SecE
MAWRIYRPNDGILIRRVATIGILLFTGFGAFRWWSWMQDETLPFAGSLGIPMWMSWGIVGATVVGLLGLLFAYWMCFVNPKSSTFLIETETELRKVSWPEYKPWFSTDAEVWGSSYVVVIVMVAMAIFLFLVDLALQRLSISIFT